MSEGESSGVRGDRPVRQGLASAEAARRLVAYGPNEISGARRVRLWSRIGAQLRDPLIVVLLAALTLTMVIGDHPDAIVIGLVVVVNTSVGVAQEVRADHAVEALAALSAPSARAMRDGTECEIAAAAVVPGDVLLLGEGDIIPADASLLESAALLVDESAVTGESVPVEKDAAAGGDRLLKAGTVVVHGRALAETTATGASSTMGRIAALLSPKAEATPLQRRLAGLGRVLALITVGLCVLVLILGLVRGQSLEVMGVTAVSLAVAAVPESLPAVVTLSLALGARRMAARRAIVRRLSAVETLGSVTVLATDKTGTLTEGVMVVEEAWTPRGRAVFTGTGYRPEGEVHLRGEHQEETGNAVRALLVAAVLCNDARLGPPSGPRESWTALGDPTEAALLAAGAKAGLDQGALGRAYERVDEVPFDSERRRMTTVHRAVADGAARVCLKGAPEAVLVPGFLEEPPELLDEAREAAARLAAEGYRVLAIAEKTCERPPASHEEAESGLALLGLVAMNDPPKDSAADTLAACRRAGITAVMITGDHPATAAAIARRLGLLPPGGAGASPTDGPEGAASQVMTGARLETAEADDLVRARVFARTRPPQKLDIIRTWRSRGDVTAMTGDGVNDGPALRQADIGVAMGHRGTEVARQAADLVLADDELGTVVAAVEEGRRIYDNIRRFLLYGLSGGAAEIAVMLLGPALGLTLPLRAGQILWINLLTHGLTGVSMGAEPASSAIMVRRPRPPKEHVLGAGLWHRVLTLGCLITVVALGAAAWARRTDGPWQSVLFLSLLAAQLGVCLGLRERRWTRQNGYLPAAVGASVALGLTALYVPALRSLLETEPLSAGELVPAVLAGVVGFVAGGAVRPHRSSG